MSRTLPPVAGFLPIFQLFSPRAAPRKRLISFARAASCVRRGSFFSLTKKFSVSSRKLLRISEIVYHISPGTSSNRTKFRMKSPSLRTERGEKAKRGKPPQTHRGRDAGEIGWKISRIPATGGSVRDVPAGGARRPRRRRGAGTKRGGFARQSGAKFPAYSHNPGD